MGRSRVRLLYVSPTDATIILNVHHAFFDVRSKQIVFDRIASIYCALLRSTPTTVEDIPECLAQWNIRQRSRHDNSSNVGAFQSRRVLTADERAPFHGTKKLRALAPAGEVSFVIDGSEFREIRSTWETHRCSASAAVIAD